MAILSINIQTQLSALRSNMARVADNLPKVQNSSDLFQAVGVVEAIKNQILGLAMEQNLIENPQFKQAPPAKS